ncbi:UDP-D-apiose/UDP-D-xylose synthase-like isoform X2 [Rhododendron vialii]|uniref:UDP-D-apiose/UDP-D-xylose synthase-like isoform X2 n=1 Tax=Rhododendron vialii TaxID=182163 RepID=UPI00265E8A50|nr:UDP-D-apiose/UDP-D-xylose synthase-like isoform X2 [Rhododendron vialii]
MISGSRELSTINLAAICTPADYNTRPLDTIYSNFIDALPVVKYCSENNKCLIHLSTCEVYGKTIGSFLPTDHPMRQVFELEEKINISSHFDEDGDYNGAAGT